MTMTTRETKNEALEISLKELRLHTVLDEYGRQAVLAEKNHWSYPQYLFSLIADEAENRRTVKIRRNRTISRLPTTKTIANLNLSLFSGANRKRFADLCTGRFITKHENVLAFGKPGVGKTHYLCAIGHELITKGFKVLFSQAFKLVENLLIAKKELMFEKALRRLDVFDLIIIDDIGYVKQDRHQMEALFSLLSERYERRSIMITSNLVFSQWNEIFVDPMTTAAAIDRLVHHAQVLEFTNDSYRATIAKNSISKE